MEMDCNGVDEFLRHSAPDDSGGQHFRMVALEEVAQADEIALLRDPDAVHKRCVNGKLSEHHSGTTLYLSLGRFVGAIGRSCSSEERVLELELLEHNQVHNPGFSYGQTRSWPRHITIPSDNYELSIMTDTNDAFTRTNEFLKLK